MKKAGILCFAPAAAMLFFYGLLGILGGFGAIEPIAWLFVALLAASGFFLFKGRWWGCVFGMAAGISFIYMSTRYTGQVIDIERPVGIVLCSYYLFCGLLILRKHCK